MKRRGFTFLLSMLMSMMGVETFAHNIAVANADGVTIYYTYINNSTELQVSYRGSSSGDYSNEYTGTVNIPETVTYNNTTYSVTSIGSYAFKGCSGLTSVTIPNSVTSIDEDAFYNTAWYNNQSDGLVYAGKVAYKYKGTMASNTSIVLDEGTLGIADSAFSGCSGMISIIIPNSVTSIGDYAFYGCSGLTSVTIPNSVTSIGENAFLNCTGLIEVTFNAKNCSSYNGIYSGSVFRNCTSINSLIIGDDVEAIPEYAFSGCIGLTEVDFNATNCTSMHDNTFSGCTNLATLTIGYNVENIPERAFCYCSGLTSVTIGNSVTSIGNMAFYRCSGLTSVTIGNSVTSIGHSAFEGCSGLTSVTIPNSVKNLGSSVFYGCI